MAGSISAFDPATGQETWRWRNDQPMCSSVLATAGDLVFAGAPSGEFYAFNARTGEFLWQFQCGSGHHSNPTTYSIDGRQYIAVPTGWGDRTERFLPPPSGRLERPCSTSSRYRISVVRLRLQRAVEWCPIVAAKLVGEGYGPPHGRVCLLRTSSATPQASLIREPGPAAAGAGVHHHTYVTVRLAHSQFALPALYAYVAEDAAKSCAAWQMPDLALLKPKADSAERCLRTAGPLRAARWSCFRRPMSPLCQGIVAICG